MNADEYLVRLQAQLKGLPPEKQMELIEEIDTHLAEGLSDPRLDTDPVERAQRLEIELGEAVYLLVALEENTRRTARRLRSQQDHPETYMPLQQP